MTTTLRHSTRVAPSAVRDTLSRHILVDGYHLVQDIEKSHGVWLHDAVRGGDMLDLFGHFSTNPIGFNHPKMANPEFAARILPAALHKPANSDVYTAFMAEFVESFSRIVPESFRRHLFFIEGGALAIENALKAAFDWKVRKNLAAGRGELGTRILHFRQAFHGRSGYTMSLTNTADPRKTQYFPKFDWPRVTNPKLRFPVTPEVERDVVRHDHVRVERDDELAVVLEGALGLQALDLHDQHGGIRDDAVPDDAELAGVEDAGRDEVEDGLLAPHHQRVAGVVPALEADHHVGVLGEEVDDLALALVAPLRTDDHDIRHEDWLLRWVATIPGGGTGRHRWLSAAAPGARSRRTALALQGLRRELQIHREADVHGLVDVAKTGDHDGGLRRHGRSSTCSLASGRMRTSPPPIWEGTKPTMTPLMERGLNSWAETPSRGMPC